MRTATKENIKQEFEKTSLAKISKEIRRGTKIKKQLQKKGKKLTGIQKTENEKYIQTINDKILLLLEGITEEKIKNSNLASVSKAFRSLLGQLSAYEPAGPKEIDKNVSINFNIDNMSKEDILKLLADKSQNQDG